MNRQEIAARIDAVLAQHGQAYVCGGTLSLYFADQALSTGVHTTPEDACGAWNKWLASQGGSTDRPAQPSDWPAGHMHRYAAAIRDAAKHV